MHGTHFWVFKAQRRHFHVSRRPGPLGPIVQERHCDSGEIEWRDLHRGTFFKNCSQQVKKRKHVVEKTGRQLIHLTELSRALTKRQIEVLDLDKVPASSANNSQPALPLLQRRGYFNFGTGSRRRGLQPQPCYCNSLFGAALQGRGANRRSRAGTSGMERLYLMRFPALNPGVIRLLLLKLTRCTRPAATCRAA